VFIVWPWAALEPGAGTARTRSASTGQLRMIWRLRVDSCPARASRASWTSPAVRSRSFTPAARHPQFGKASEVFRADL